MAKDKVICDTDVLIDYWNLNNKRHKKTKSILDEDIGLDNVVIAAIVKMELLLLLKAKNIVAN